VLLENHACEAVADEDADRHCGAEQSYIEGLNFVVHKHTHKYLRLDCSEGLHNTDYGAAADHDVVAGRCVHFDGILGSHSENKEAYCCN